MLGGGQVGVFRWVVEHPHAMQLCLLSCLPPPSPAHLPACSADRNRWRVGLLPFPRAVPPPPPPSEDRTKEILADPRVQAVKERETQVGGEGLGCGSLLR